MPRLLVSVRDGDEALAAAAAGADFIDLKDPAAGALGGLAPERIAAVVALLRAHHPGLPISATIGDVPAAEIDEIARRTLRVGACGVDYVKVGLDGRASRPVALALLARLAQLGRGGLAIVPVLLADDGVDDAIVDAALLEDIFPALMLDTTAKRGGSLLQRVTLLSLAAFVAAVRRHGRLAGLAGALRSADVTLLNALGPDFAGFRSAVCSGERAGPLDAGRVRELRGRLAAGTRARGGMAALQA